MIRFLSASENASLSSAYYTSRTQMKLCFAAKLFLLRFVLASCLGNLILLSSVWPDIAAQSVEQGEAGDDVWIELLPFIILHHLLRYVSLRLVICNKVNQQLHNLQLYEFRV